MKSTFLPWLSICYIFAIELRTSTSAYLSTKSEFGRKLLASARRIEDNADDYSWMADYSLKFQGCHHIRTWNEDAEQDSDDVRIKTTRLVRFRLCPTNNCSQRSRSGCKKGYGDYIVDVYRYISAYSQAQRRQDEYDCKSYLYKHCDCEDSDDKEEDFDQDLCEYQCYNKARKYSCIEKNPYYDDDGQDQEYLDDKTLEKYLEGCTQFEPPEYEDGERRLEGDDEEEEELYYIGSYCADQGGKILLGMFIDESCTIFADKNAGRTTYKQLTRGQELPYSDYSMVRSDCVSCEDQDFHNGEKNNDDAEDEIRISDACQKVYRSAGKCETQMEESGRFYLNNNACYYIEGIKIIRRDGIIDTSFSRPNKVASFFIFLFAVSFVLLGAIIYYFRMKLGMKINLVS